MSFSHLMSAANGDWKYGNYIVIHKEGVKIVAVVGGREDDWAMYIGSPFMDDEEVMDHGHKISEDEARTIFADFLALHYRR